MTLVNKKRRFRKLARWLAGIYLFWSLLVFFGSLGSESHSWWPIFLYPIIWPLSYIFHRLDFVYEDPAGPAFYIVVGTAWIWSLGHLFSIIATRLFPFKYDNGGRRALGSQAASMHVGTLNVVDWEPRSALEEGMAAVVSRNPELCKCVVDCGHTQIRGVALSIGDERIYVHIESSICEHCEMDAGPCAVPDFSVARPAYFEFVARQPRQACPHCGKFLNRRCVLRRLR